jgi:hypothetical protein
MKEAIQTSDWAAEHTRLLPLLRVVPKFGLFGWYDSVTAIFPNQIISGWSRQLELLHVKSHDPIQFSKQLHDSTGLAIEESTRVQLFPGGRVTRRATLRIDGAKRRYFSIPHDQTTHIAGFLSELQKKHFTLGTRVPLHGSGILAVLLILWLVLAVIVVASGVIELPFYPPDLDQIFDVSKLDAVGTQPETNSEAIPWSTESVAAIASFRGMRNRRVKPKVEGRIRVLAP